LVIISVLDLSPLGAEMICPPVVVGGYNMEAGA
jgi:hypothetical protein